MKLLQIASGLLFACSSATVWACEQPTLPVIPTKQELSIQQRRQALKNTRNYTKGMAAYVACLKAALKHVGQKPVLAPSRMLLSQSYNTAIREFNVVMALYVKHIGSIDSLRIGWFVTGRPRTCIPLAETRKMTALNDYLMLFDQKSGEVYLNVLPTKCLGLRYSRGGVAYETFGGFEELCKTDLITLIHSSRAGNKCTLGLFYALTNEQVATLLGKGKLATKSQ